MVTISNPNHIDCNINGLSLIQVLISLFKKNSETGCVGPNIVIVEADDCTPITCSGMETFEALLKQAITITENGPALRAAYSLQGGATLVSPVTCGATNVTLEQLAMLSFVKDTEGNIAVCFQNASPALQ